MNNKSNDFTGVIICIIYCLKRLTSQLDSQKVQDQFTNQVLNQYGGEDSADVDRSWDAMQDSVSPMQKIKNDALYLFIIFFFLNVFFYNWSDN